MGNQDNCLSVLPKFPDNLQQGVDFLWSQHSRGLVKDQDLRLSVEHLQNFHPLLRGNIHVSDNVLRIYGKAVLLREGPDLAVGLPDIHGGKKAQNLFHRFHAHDNVLRYGIVGNQLKVLMHHADVQPRGMIGRLQLHLLAPDKNLSFIRLIHTEQHTHQRGFARAVLSQQSINLALPDLDGHVIVGHNTRKPLGDMLHLHNKLIISHTFLLCVSQPQNMMYIPAF